MVVGFNVMGKASGNCPPDEWHESLKESEEETHLQNDSPSFLPDDDTADYRDGETIHSQGYREEKEIECTHNVSCECKGTIK